MSQEGYDKLVAELKQLVSVERPKASAAIAEASAMVSFRRLMLSSRWACASLAAAQHRQRADYVEGRDDQHG